MASTPPPPSSSPSTPPSSAAEQARIRKERREAKIKAGGSARLDRITGLGGGVKRDVPPQPTVTPAGDPDEVDISQHYYEPAPRSRVSTSQGPQQQQQMSDDVLRQMMLGFDPSNAPPPGAGTNPFAGFPGLGQVPAMEGGPPADDPMLKMLQQMMGGVPGEGAGGIPSFPGLGNMPGMPGQTTPSQADPYAYIWRLVHAFFALSLGLYISLSTNFLGTKLARLSSSESATLTSSNFFWIFATAELVLQSTRFFLEKGRGPSYEGVVGMVVGFLPLPWKRYVDTVARYARIWTTVTGDAFVCVFVLGVFSWWRAGGTA